MLKLLHISDVHFDAVYGQYSDQLQHILRSSLETAFERAVDFACEKEVDLLLISGDILDQGELRFSTEQFIRKQVDRLEMASVKTVMIHGNHDPSCRVKWTSLGASVHIGEKPHPETIELKTKSGWPLFVSFNGFEEPSETHSYIEKFPVRSGSAYHVGVLHAFIASGQNTQAHDPYMMTTLDTLKDKQYDYWALGHIHQKSEFTSHKAAYSGSLQGLHINDCGTKGGLYVELESPGLEPVIRFEPFSNVEFQKMKIELSGVADSLHKVSEHCINTVMEGFGTALNQGKHVFMRIELSGMNSVYDKLQNHINLKELEMDIMEACGLTSLEIRTASLSPRLDTEEILSSSPFAAFISEMLESDQGRKDIIEYAKRQTFIESPSSPVDTDAWLGELLSGVDETWLNKMVKIDED